MKHVLVLSSVLLSMAAWAAEPAAPKVNLVDHSNGNLINEGTARDIMAANIPSKVWKVYPASKYAFVSQVEGGLTAARTCVVAARVMLLPLTPQMKAVLFRPQKTATAFDAVVSSSTEQCQALARDKLKEATSAVVSSLVKT